MPTKILIIDDSPSIRTIVKLYLMGRGLEFIEATDGAHGLQLAAERGVDLVIADFNMPVMNGIDFVQNLRVHDNAALREVPVILLTANKDDEVRQRAMEVGVSAFTVKPISRDQLTATVRRYLRLEEPAGEPLGAAHSGAEALLFSLGAEVFAFPIGRVRQVLRACWPQPVPRPPLGCLGVIEVSGEVVPILDLAVLLALRRPLPQAALPEKMLDTHFLLTGAEDGEIGFWVDRVLEVADIRALEDLTTDPRLEALGKSASWVVGLSAAGDRRALVLDPSAVVTASRRRLLRRAVLRKAV